MQNTFITIPMFTTLKDIESKNYSLSATQYKSIHIINKNVKPLSFFLKKALDRTDLGMEVGSDCYVEKSPFLFVKTKALTKESFLLDETEESIECITPKSFNSSNLKEGDLLISKDSNVGEIVVLDKDYPKTMLCSGIYKLPVVNNKFYVLAFVKSLLFRQQIDFLVPRGSTIRHGKTKFLDCLIPLPNYNMDETIQYVEALTKAIINKEIKIKNKVKQIDEIIINELKKHQQSEAFNYSFPSLQDIENVCRIDARTYSEKFKKAEFLIKNYKNGVTYINEKNVCSGNTPKKRIISEENELKFYWVTPSIYNNLGILNSHPTIDCTENNINQNCLLIVNRTSKGEDGKYVGLSYFYDYEHLGKGQCNQGIYKVFNYSDNDLMFFNAMLNSSLYRTYCGSISMGSKMREIKTQDVIKIPFPMFPKTKKEEIINNYHVNGLEYEPFKCDLMSFTKYDEEFNHIAGIYELDRSMRYLQEKLTQAIYNIANDKPVIIQF